MTAFNEPATNVEDHSPVGHSGVSAYFRSGTQPRLKQQRRSSLRAEIILAVAAAETLDEIATQSEAPPLWEVHSYCVCPSGRLDLPSERLDLIMSMFAHVTGFTLSRHAFLATSTPRFKRACPHTRARRLFVVEIQYTRLH